jgi:YggT family protein
MTQNFVNAGVFLIQTFGGLLLMIVLIRLLIQVSRADYYNPISQAIVKLTDPAIKPLKRILPTLRGVDFATLLVALLVQLITVCLIMVIYGNYLFHPAYIAWSLVGLLSTILDIYFFALIIMVIASWLAPHSNHPALALVHQLTDPLCVPARKLLPAMGGIDFSIILVFVAIRLIDSFLVIPPLVAALGIPQGLIMGL